MRPRSAMFEYQKEAVRRASTADELALLLSPGDGKTVITETDLLDRGEWPALVIAPASVVEADVWGDEARQWEHLRRLSVTPVVGSPDRRRKLLAEPSHIEAVSYENYRWLTSVVPVEKRYRAIVFDELSKMKDPGTRRFRRSRGRTQRIGIRRGLTGSPVPNHLMDLWGEMFTVAGAKPLGPTFTAFQSTWFEAIDFQSRVWKLKCCPKCVTPGEGNQRHGCSGHWLNCECHKAAIAAIRERVRPWVHALPPGGGAVKPPVRLTQRTLAMPAQARRISEELMAQLWAELPSGFELEALSSSTVAGKLRQIAGGAVYTNQLTTDAENVGMSHGHSVEYEALHTAKLDALEELLDEFQGEPVVVFYWFKHEKARIEDRLGKRAWADFSYNGPEVARQWNAGQLEVMLMHPQSAGFGLNLQHGGSHVIWYALPHSHELWVQGNGRLARPGQVAPWVSAIQLLCGPMDAMIASGLQHKGRIERSFMEGLS